MILETTIYSNGLGILSAESFHIYLAILACEVLIKYSRLRKTLLPLLFSRKYFLINEGIVVTKYKENKNSCLLHLLNRC